MTRTGIAADLRASIVVFLVALPLAMGIAMASGYPPVAGLITGVIGGLVVGALSGAPLQVSGAAAGLTVVVYQGVQQFGLPGMAVVLCVAGLIQLAAGIAGIGRWFQAVSPTVLYGMLAGIGVLIVAGQAHVMLDGTARGDGLENLRALPESIASASWTAFALAAAVIAIMVWWPKKLSAIIPAPLVAIASATIVAFAFGLDVKLVDIPKNLFAEFGIAKLDFGALITNGAMFGAALQLALIASAESLLCAAAVDQMHSGQRADLSKELRAQGIGNALCGVLGVLPMTGVIVRSSANIAAGAKTRVSAMLHGVWLLALVVLAPGILGHVPTAALAGLLVFTGVKLVNVKVMRELARTGRAELAIYAATLGTIVAYDLLVGVLLGLALSGLKLLWSLARLSITVAPEPKSNRLVVELRGAATFLGLPQLSGALESVPPGRDVLVRATGLHLIDQACLEHLESWRRRFELRGGKIESDGRLLFTQSSA